MPVQSTAIIARIIGPMLVIVGLAIVVRPSIFIGAIDTFWADAAAPLLWGIISLLLGLTILALHWRWRRPVEIAVTLIGVLSLARGVALLFVPEPPIAFIRAVLADAPLAVVTIGAAGALLGAWLSYEGFRAKVEP